MVDDHRENDILNFKDIMTRRRWLSTLAATTTASFAGCIGGDDNSNSPGNTGTGQKVNWWNILTSEQSQTFAKNTISQFENDHDYQVNQTVYANNQYKPAITNALGTDNSPEMFFIWPGPTRLGRYVDDGLIMKLDDYFSQEDLDGFLDITLDQCRYKGGDIFGWGVPSGNLYSIPSNLAGIMIWYNKPVLQEAGVDPGKLKHRLDLSWKQFLNICDTIKNETDKSPIVVGNRGRWTIGHWISAFFIKAVGTDTYLDTAYARNNMDWTAEPYVEALNRLQMLQEKGYMKRGINALSNNEAASLFFQGKAAFYHQGTWLPNMVADQAPKNVNIPDDLDYMWWPFFPEMYPDGKSERIGLTDTTNAIPVRTKKSGEQNLKSTIEWLKYWTTNKEVLKGQIKNLAYIVPHLDVWNEMDLNAEQKVLRSALMDMRDASRLGPVFDVAFLPEPTEKLLSGGQQLFNGVPPKRILRDLQQAQSKAIKQYK